jgi:NAD(P)-dependent dehydrogenase (short-subunit alcohol dehydrogenase family)
MRAVIFGASGGIGAALVQTLTAKGEVIGLSRRDHRLELTNEASIVGAVATLEGSFDLVIVATGALVINGIGPEKSLRALSAETMTAQFALNAIGPALVLKHMVRHMPRDRVSRFAVLSARVGSIGDNALGGWYAYRAAKSALNQLIHTASIEVARTHPHAIVVALHPGTVDTALTAAHAGGHPTVTPAEAATNLLAVLDRLTPADTGGFFDWKGETIPW